jgi:hypothetical protein
LKIHITRLEMAVQAETVEVSTGRPLDVLEIASADNGHVTGKAFAACERLVDNTTTCSTGWAPVKLLVQLMTSFASSNRP